MGTRRMRNDGAEGAATPVDPAVQAQVETMLQAAADQGRPRVITVAGHIDDDVVRHVAGELSALNLESPEPVAVQFSSPGGSLQYGWALYDLFATNACPIITVGFGYVGSAAAIAFQGGVLRLIAPHARLMIHQVGISLENASLDVGDMRKQLTEMEGLQRTIERLFARRTGNPIKKIRAWCAEEKEFTARQAVTAGFADQVLKARPLARKGKTRS